MAEPALPFLIGCMPAVRVAPLWLRLEDTDKVRSTQESVDAIFQGLEWLGIDWDEGPFYQSKRTEIYEEYIQKLLDTGNAYYCTCTPEELDEKRKAAMARGDKPKYDGACREKGLKKCEGGRGPPESAFDRQNRV